LLYDNKGLYSAVDGGDMYKNLTSGSLCSMFRSNIAINPGEFNNVVDCDLALNTIQADRGLAGGMPLAAGVVDRWLTALQMSTYLMIDRGMPTATDCCRSAQPTDAGRRNAVKCLFSSSEALYIGRIWLIQTSCKPQ
jgi:hypothetical protein